MISPIKMANKFPIIEYLSGTVGKTGYGFLKEKLM